MNTCGSAIRVISRSLCSGDVSDQWKNVLDYWFSPGAEKKWFHGGPQVDEEMRQKFGSMVSKIILKFSLYTFCQIQGRGEWAQSPFLRGRRIPCRCW